MCHKEAQVSAEWPCLRPSLHLWHITRLLLNYAVSQKAVRLWLRLREDKAALRAGGSVSL